VGERIDVFAWRKAAASVPARDPGWHKDYRGLEGQLLTAYISGNFSSQVLADACQIVQCALPFADRSGKLRPGSPLLSRIVAAPFNP
jgi:hypothetical protein